MRESLKKDSIAAVFPNGAHFLQVTFEDIFYCACVSVAVEKQLPLLESSLFGRVGLGLCQILHFTPPNFIYEKVQI